VRTESYVDEAQAPRVRFAMSVAGAEALANLLVVRSAGTGGQRLLDQLWLRTVLIEQWRRTRVAEREAFQERADRA
jgi:hypothetical protein